MQHSIPTMPVLLLVLSRWHVYVTWATWHAEQELTASVIDLSVEHLHSHAWASTGVKKNLNLSISCQTVKE